MSHESTWTTDDLTMSVVRANVVGSIVALTAITGIIGAHVLIWGQPSYDELEWATSWLMLTLLVLSILGHELLHIVAFIVFARATRDTIRLGFHWRCLTPYATTTAAMTARSYRLTVMLPGLVLGIVPVVAGLSTGWFPITAYGAVMLAGSAGDALVWWRMRKVDPSCWVRDSPDRIGCVLSAQSR